MKLNAVNLAHATAVITAGLYIICWALVGTTPMFYRGVMRSWMHGIDISTLPLSPMPFGLSLYGLITMTVVAWVTFYVFAHIYNGLGKN